MVGRDVGGQAKWQWGSPKRMQILLLFKKHKSVFCISRVSKSIVCRLHAHSLGAGQMHWKSSPILARL